MIVGIAGRKRSGKDTLGAALVKLGFQRVAFADGVRELVAETFGWPLELVNSDAFKEQIAAAAAHPTDFIWGRSEAGSLLHGRELLQRTGMAARKVFGDDAWVKLALAKCHALDAIEKGHDALELLDIFEATGKVPPSPLSDATQRALAALSPRELEIVRMRFTPAAAFTPAVAQHYVITDVRFPVEFHAIKAAGGKVIRLNTAASAKTLHEFESNDGVISDRCIHWFDMSVYGEHRELMSGPRQCGLPASVHPISYSEDQHASEVSLPDKSNDAIDYDAVLTSDLETNTATGVIIVREWL